MTNKKKLVKAINKDFDKKNNYSLILEKIDDTSRPHFRLKYALPIASVIILLLVISSSKSANNFNATKYNKDNYVTINKDIIILNTALKNDKTYSDKHVSSYKNNGQYIPYFDFEDKLKLPEDIDNKNYKEVLSKSSSLKDNAENDDNYYRFHYFNTKNERQIVIAFHKINENMDATPSSNKDDKISRINGVDMYIYNYENKYIARFEYDKLSFNVTSTDLHEKEFIDLLKSIVQ